MLPEGLQAVIDRSAWPVPPLFRWLQAHGGIDPLEMYRVFNMGIGMVAAVSRAGLGRVAGGRRRTGLGDRRSCAADHEHEVLLQ